VDLPISIEIYQQLLGASARGGFQKEAWEIGAAAIRDWMVRNDPDSFAMPATSGYQWKRLFLPNGTLLRTVFNGKNYHCLVEDDHIRYNGQSVSPSGFANAVGGVRRNAWKVIWILFPNCSEWKLAGTLRAKKAGQRPGPSKEQRTDSAAPQPGASFPQVAPGSDAGQPQPIDRRRQTGHSHQHERDRDRDRQFASGKQAWQPPAQRHVPAPLAERTERSDGGDDSDGSECGPVPHRAPEYAAQHRPRQPVDERHYGDDRRWGGRWERRAGLDRRGVQHAFQQQRAPYRIASFARTNTIHEPGFEP
jgi:hypothetical protein